LKILHQDCDPSVANIRSLPYTCYLVWYENENKICYDLVIPDKKVDIFDYYWDRYREKFKGFKQSEGRVNPRMWNTSDKKTSKENRSR